MSSGSDTKKPPSPSAHPYVEILPAVEILELTLERNEIREQLADTSLRNDL
jgi:hypothetical protein